MSRGGKEGNTAFEGDLDDGAYPYYPLANTQTINEIICTTEGIKKETIQLISANLERPIGDAVRAGNLTVASMLCMCQP